MAFASYIGRGTVKIGTVGTTPATALGNCSQFKYQQSWTEKTLKDYTSANAGNAASLKRIDSRKVIIVCHDLTQTNMDLALDGGEKAIKLEGVNDIDTGHTCDVVIQRGSFSPASEMDFIGEDYFGQQFEIEVLSPTTGEAITVTVTQA